MDCIEVNRDYADTRRNGRRAGMHVFAYEEAYGPVPAGCVVMHTCDNPKCINPKHLVAGTQADNVRDCIAKGRGNRPKGERNGHSKMTEETVVYAMARMLAGEKQKSVTAFFGVDQSIMSEIWTGKIWKEALK